MDIDSLSICFFGTHSEVEEATCSFSKPGWDMKKLSPF